MTKRDIIDTIDELMVRVSLLIDIADNLEIDEDDKVPESISLDVGNILLDLEKNLY
jgi:hypothetical protein